MNGLAAAATLPPPRKLWKGYRWRTWHLLPPRQITEQLPQVHDELGGLRLRAPAQGFCHDLGAVVLGVPHLDQCGIGIDDPVRPDPRR